MSRITAAALATTLGAVLGLALLAAGATNSTAASAAPAAELSAAAAGALQPVAITPGVSPVKCQNGSASLPQRTSNTVSSMPWEQKALDYQDAWQYSQGSGIRVAVVDSGLNYNPQLAGREFGIDLTGSGLEDCVGHGTAVAGIIGASIEQNQGNEFAGVAPAATILSVKVTNVDQNQAGSANATLAQGIMDAAELHAQVISISIQAPDTAPLAHAVQFALSRGAVVVAAGGNDSPQTGIGPFFPASYPGVLSVGAVDDTGGLGKFSDQRSHVQVTAPGVRITSFTEGGFYDQWTGTSFATPFVSGVAALVRAYSGSLTESEVVSRIVATADGPAGGGTGAGMVNPVQAITELLPPINDQSAGPSQQQSVQVSRALPPATGTRNAMMVVTVSSVGGAALLALASLVLVQGRRRRWQPDSAAARGTASGTPTTPGPGPAGIPADPSEVLGGG